MRDADPSDVRTSERLPRADAAEALSCADVHIEIRAADSRALQAALDRLLTLARDPALLETHADGDAPAVSHGGLHSSSQHVPHGDVHVRCSLTTPPDQAAATSLPAVGAPPDTAPVGPSAMRLSSAEASDLEAGEHAWPSPGGTLDEPLVPGATATPAARCDAPVGDDPRVPSEWLNLTAQPAPGNAAGAVSAQAQGATAPTGSSDRGARRAVFFDPPPRHRSALPAIAFPASDPRGARIPDAAPQVSAVTQEGPDGRLVTGAKRLLAGVPARARSILDATASQIRMQIARAESAIRRRLASVRQWRDARVATAAGRASPAGTGRDPVPTRPFARRSRSESRPVNRVRLSGVVLLVIAVTALGLLIGVGSPGLPTATPLGERPGTAGPGTIQRGASTGPSQAIDARSVGGDRLSDLQRDPAPGDIRTRVAASALEAIPASAATERDTGAREEPRAVPEDRRAPPVAAARATAVAQTPAARANVRSARSPAASAPASFHGTLEVTSVPAGAMVAVNNRAVGRTPLVLTDWPAGTHTVRVELDGYRRWGRAVQVTADKRATVSADLRRAP